MSYPFIGFSSNNPFSINPTQFYIESHQTKSFECIFQPKIISNIHFAELEATIHFDPNRPASDVITNFEILPKYVAPMSISITATGNTVLFIYSTLIGKWKQNLLYCIIIIIKVILLKSLLMVGNRSVKSTVK